MFLVALGAIYDVVAYFNTGCQASVKILEELVISSGHY